MGDHVNIFSLARRGESRDENHIIELLAFLLQQHPGVVPMWLADIDPQADWPSGWVITTQHVLPSRRRPDLLLHVPNAAAVLVEVKVASGEGESQLADYAAHLKSERTEPIRRLIYLVKDAAAGAPAAVHSTEQVPVHAATWQRLQQLLVESGVGGLAEDFAEMLREEGLAMPERVTPSELREWEAGAKVMRRLQLLLDAARPGLEALVPAQSWTGPMSTSTEKIYRLFASEAVLYGVGFNPGSLWNYPAIIDFYVMDKTMPAGSRREEARRLRARRPDLVSWVEWGETPKRSRAAAEILTAATFDEQVEQIVEFARASLQLFREEGYPTSGLADA